MNNVEMAKRESAVDAALRSLEVSIERMLGTSSELNNRLEPVMTPASPAPPNDQRVDIAKALEEPSPIVRWIQKLKAQLDSGRSDTEMVIARLQL